MAVISDLVRVVAEIEGFEENFVSVYARSAREAGYISHHGRGRNAAKMTALDAAHLLVAVNASPLAKEVPETIALYRNMRCRKTHNNELANKEYERALGAEGTTIVDALCFLLEKNDDESLRIDDFRKTEATTGGAYPVLLNNNLSVEFIGPQSMAKITIKAWRRLDPNKGHSFCDIAAYRYINLDHASTHFGSDRKVTTTISSETLYQVSKVLHTT